MTNSPRDKSSPIEVWLSQSNMSVACRVVFEDETAEPLRIDSLSMRGAQREITAYLIESGYTPVGRWETEAAAEDSAIEVSRKFRAAAGMKAELADDNGRRGRVLEDLHAYNQTPQGPG